MGNEWKCGAFNAGLTIHPDGKVSPCCQIDRRYFKNVKDLDWKDPWIDLRDGRGCDSCKIPGQVYKTSFDDYLDDRSFSVKFLDVRNNNLCNMECVICNPYYSSKWADRLGKDRFVSTEFDIDVSAVDRIYFAGGEPFLNKTHWDILTKIKNPQDISLIYSTNLSHLGNVEDLWKGFKSIIVNVSLDGIGKFGEQMRPGLDWSRWQKNMRILKSFENVSIEIASTVSLLNIWHVQEMEDYAKTNDIPIRFYRLDNPRYLCLSSLPLELKNTIRYIPTDSLKEILTQDTSYLFKHTIANVLLGDKLRKTNLWDYLPFEKYAINNILNSHE